MNRTQPEHAIRAVADLTGEETFRLLLRQRAAALRNPGQPGGADYTRASLAG